MKYYNMMSNTLIKMYIEHFFQNHTYDKNILMVNNFLKFKKNYLGQCN